MASVACGEHAGDGTLEDEWITIFFPAFWAVAVPGEKRTGQQIAAVIGGQHATQPGRARNGADEDELRKLAAESAANGRVHFTGFKNQTYMPVLYQSADLFCLPSKSESWGLAVNEAMACGKAILASDKCGCAINLIKDKKVNL